MRMKEFMKTTIVGGIVFLLPLVLTLVILEHAMRLAGKVAGPISKSLHLGSMGQALGVSTATIIALLVLFAVSFAAGLVARTKAGARMSGWAEDSILGGLPQYKLMKSVAQGLVQIEQASGLKPVLASIEDGWQIGYLLEAVGNDWVAVFLPQAPTPTSGNVMYLPADRIKPLDIPMTRAIAVIKAIGVGSADLLRGIDLARPGRVSSAG